jgi:hypothetical protein
VWVGRSNAMQMIKGVAEEMKLFLRRAGCGRLW